MKKAILILLTLCVSLGTLARSQVIISVPQARQLIAKLDTLDYLRVGYALSDSAISNMDHMLYYKDTLIAYKDSIIKTQFHSGMALLSDNNRLKAENRSWKWKAYGCGAVAVLALLLGVMK